MAAFADIEAALDSVERYEDMRSPLQALATTAGMQSYAAIRLRGAASNQLIQVFHNAPESHAGQCETADYWHASSLVQRLLNRAPPLFFDGRVDTAAPSEIPGFEHGVAACTWEERGACLLVLARSKPLAPNEQMTAVRPAMLVAARLLEALSKLHAKACPLSDRQLDCKRPANPS